MTDERTGEVTELTIDDPVVGELSLRIQWSNPRKELCVAMLAAQRLLKPAVKAMQNKHLGTDYAGLENILEAYRPFLDQGILLTQDAQIVGEELVLVTELTHVESMQWVRNVLGCKPNSGKNALHELGGTITYLRRYAIPPLTGICAGEDNDGNHGGQDKQQPKQQRRDQERQEEQLPTDEEFARFQGKFKELAGQRFSTEKEARAWLKDQEPNIRQAYMRRLKQILAVLTKRPVLEVGEVDGARTEQPNPDTPPTGEDQQQRQKLQQRWMMLVEGKLKGLPKGQAVAVASWWAGQACGWVHDADKGRPSAKLTPLPQIKLAVDMLSKFNTPDLEKLQQDFAAWQDDQRVSADA